MKTSLFGRNKVDDIRVAELKKLAKALEKPMDENLSMPPNGKKLAKKP